MVHRNASLLAVGFLAIHVTTLLFDPYTQLRLVDFVLPFDGDYRPLWLGLGTLGLDLLLALVLTSLLRDRLGLGAWRAVRTSPGRSRCCTGWVPEPTPGTCGCAGTVACCGVAVAAALVWRFLLPAAGLRLREAGRQ
jgi:sulfoxide reductase heme-binding subunit YedZ